MFPLWPLYLPFLLFLIIGWWCLLDKKEPPKNRK